MAAIAHSIDSFLQRLESAKNLFRSEMYGEAADSFQDLLRAALPGAPDVFIAAVYGLAECQRLSRNFGAAADNYQALLTRYCSSPSLWAGGRLAESNRSLALQAWLSLGLIGRLSLRVITDELSGFLAGGQQWAHDLTDTPEGADAFRLALTLLDRNVSGPAVAAMKLSRLLSEVRKHASLPSAADAIMVELRLFETQIDTGTTPKSRPSPPASHWTASWASAFYRLQCARAALLEGRTSQAQAAATEVAGDIAMREYPELRLLVQQIAARSCSPSHKQNGIALYRKAILDLTDLDTHGETLDLSHPIWHFCALIRLQIESGLAGSPECAADLNLLRKYLDRDSLRSVIASRGLSPAGFDELRRHITDHSLEAAWSRSGEFLMNRLSQAVRP